LRLFELVTSVIGDLGVNLKPLVVLTLWIKCTVHRNQTTPGVSPSGDVCRGTKKIRRVVATLNMFGIFTPNFGENEPILTSIFFILGVGSTTN